MLHVLGLADNPSQTALPLRATPAEQAILDLLVAGERDGDILLNRSNLSVDEFNQSLTMLEITGKARSLGAGQWAIN